MYASTILISLAAVFGSIHYINAEVHEVWVGGENGELQFFPEAMSAMVGDQVVFNFNPKNHTVTQSSLDSPCGLKEGGFDSGFMPVHPDSTGEPPATFTISVDDEKPIWAFCGQRTPKSHCGEGMVFAINCGADGEPNSFTNFKASAIEFGKSLAASASESAPSEPSTDASASSSPTDTAPAMSSVTPVYEIPAEPIVTVVTQVITLTLSNAPEPSIWTTTYGSYPGSPDATPVAAEGVVHKVIVGGDAGLVFDPPRVDAKPRDIIEFEFRQKNHTVTQSSFDNPCQKLDADSAFDSGFIPVEATATEFPTWRVTVNDTTPIWAYCKQKTPASHCEAGMLFAVNSVEESPRNFTAYMGVAQALSANTASNTTTDAGETVDDSDSAMSTHFSVVGAMTAAWVAIAFSAWA